METGQRKVGSKRTAKEREVEDKEKKIPTKTYPPPKKKRNSKQSDRKKWCRSCLTQENARKRENIEDKIKTRENEDGKHSKIQSLGHQIIFTCQTPYVTCNSPHAELARDQDVRPLE